MSLARLSPVGLKGNYHCVLRMSYAQLEGMTGASQLKTESTE